MNIIESKMQFEGYQVKKIQFELLPPISEKGTFDLVPTFSKNIRQINENEYALQLGVSIRPMNDAEKTPFWVEIVIEGKFRIENIADHILAMNTNAIAILFPYLRSTLSFVSTLMNINSILLPTINLVEMFQRNEPDSDNQE